MIKLLVD